MHMRLTLMALAAAGAAAAQEADPEVGQEIFMSYCAQCHGFDATGVGPMAEILSVVTPDLTGLALRNDGVFPTAEVATKIDGRTPVLSHGGDMPLFGQFFDAGESVLVRLPSGQSMMMSVSLASVLSYLESIQSP